MKNEVQFFIVFILSRYEISHASTPRMFDLDEKLNRICIGDENPCDACTPKPDLKREPKRDPNDSFWLNIELVNETIKNNRKKKIVFLGDSITEQLNGRWRGRFFESFTKYPPILKHFFKDNALALGIMGNQVSYLHWRIRNGEVPDALNSKIWWVLIGTNNLHSCEARYIHVGILQVVEEIRKRKPDAIIVVNGILPHNNVQSEFWSSIKEINVKLERSVQGEKNVYYFDAFPYFYDKARQTIRPELYNGHVHLNENGYKCWFEAIVNWTHTNLGIDLTN